MLPPESIFTVEASPGSSWGGVQSMSFMWMMAPDTEFDISTPLAMIESNRFFMNSIRMTFEGIGWLRQAAIWRPEPRL